MTDARRAHAVLWAGQFTAVAGLTVMVPLLPFYLAELGAGPGEVALWTGVGLAAPAATQMLSAPLWGWIGDRYGHKVMVVRAQAGLAIAVALMALAGSPTQFLAFRLLQGVCGGLTGATAAFAAATDRPERRGRALGRLYSATAAGSLAGPLLGAGLASRFGFEVLFLSIAGLLGVVAVLSSVLLAEPRPVPARVGSPEPAVRTERLAAAVRSGLRTRTSRTVLLAGLSAQAAAYALVVVFAPRVAQLTGSLGAATMWVGGLQAATWGASLLGGAWWGARNDRRAARHSFTVGALGCGLAVALQALPAAPEWLLPLRLAQGFCFAALLPSVLCVVSRDARDGERGAALGLATGVLEAGQVVGPLLGMAAAMLAPLPVVFVAVGALFALAAAGTATGSVRRVRRWPHPVAETPVRPQDPVVTGGRVPVGTGTGRSW